MKKILSLGKALERGSFGLVATAVGALFLLGGLAGLIYTGAVERQRLSHGVVTTAVVVERTDRRAIVVEYQQDGSKRRAGFDSVTWNLDERELAVGTRLEVVDDHAGQPWVRSDRDDITRWWLAIGSGALLAFLGVVARYSGGSWVVDRDGTG